MKILHAADIHLGSKIESKFPKTISDKRKKELLSTFDRMVEYAVDNGIKIVLLSGDVFDSDKPTVKVKEYFYKVIKDNPDIDFLYLNGNHDKAGSYVEEIDNLKTFNKESVTTYNYGDIDISGIELTSTNASSFYSKIILDSKKTNIVMLHGEVSNTVGTDKIKIDNLKNKGIDYLALGHIHSFGEGKIDDRGIYVYPGCLEGRGFDEFGEKGFVVLDVTDKISYEFVPFACRYIYNVDVDVFGAKDLHDIVQKVKDEVKSFDKKDILRITLKGELPADIEFEEDDIKSLLEANFFFIDVKNETSLEIKVEDYDSDNSLIGEFIRGTASNSEYTDEQKQKIINLGLRVINGKEID